MSDLVERQRFPVGRFEWPTRVTAAEREAAQRKKPRRPPHNPQQEGGGAQPGGGWRVPLPQKVDTLDQTRPEFRPWTR